MARTAVDASDDPDERHRLSRLLADLMVTLGRPSEVVDVLDQSLSELGDGDPRRPLLAGEVALARFTSGDLDGARSTAETALAGGDAVAEVLGGLILARLDAHDHNYRSGARRGWKVAEQADAEGTGAAHRYLPWFFCALTGFDLDSPEGPAALTRGRDRCDQHATYWATPLYDGLAAAMAYREGRYDDCLAEAEASYESALETGSVQGIVWCLAHRALVELDRGDEHATDTLAEAESWWSTGCALLGIDHYFLATARHRQRAGDLVGAFDHLAGGWELFDEMGLANCQPLLAPDLARLATALGHRDRADAVGAAMAALAARGETLSHAALAAWCGGLASGDDDLVEQANRIFTKMRRGTDALWSGMGLAVLQGRAGQRPEARDTRDQVVALLERQQLAALEREFLRATEPFELGKTRRHMRHRFGWSSLTRTERAIVDAVVDGRTNTEIADNRSVSIRTVESHLHRVYPELGADTRSWRSRPRCGPKRSEQCRPAS